MGHLLRHPQFWSIMEAVALIVFWPTLALLIASGVLSSSAKEEQKPATVAAPAEAVADTHLRSP